jgi:FMN phosphatase YigB (HAD superfamily)
MAHVKYTSLVLDVGGVLLFYSTGDATALHPRQMKSAFDSSVWHAYQRGDTSQAECYQEICQVFGFDVETWKLAVDQVRMSLKPNDDFISALKQLKARQPNLRIYGLSNMSEPDYQSLKPVIDSWQIFDAFYPSAGIRCRKPEIVCYNRLIRFTHLDASTCIFVDDCLENVAAAHSVGFGGVHFTNTESTVAELHTLMQVGN